HDGFLGHSYLGEWVNLGAGTQVADLRNDYEPVRVRVDGDEVDTGLLKVGAFLGDFSRTGVGVLLDCGTAAGAFSELLPWGSSLPRLVPPFCTVWQGAVRERPRLRRLFDAAAAAMRRRGRAWGAEHAEFFLGLYDASASRRREAD